MRYQIIYILLLSHNYLLTKGWNVPRNSKFDQNGHIGRPFKYKQTPLPRDVIITPGHAGPFIIPYKELKESAFWDADNLRRMLDEGIQLYGASLHPLAATWINRRLEKINANNEPLVARLIDNFTKQLGRTNLQSVEWPVAPASEIINCKVTQDNIEQFIVNFWDYLQLKYFKSLIPGSVDMEFCWAPGPLVDTISSFPYCKHDIYTFWDGDSLALPQIIFNKELLFDSATGNCFKNVLKLTVYRSLCELFYNLHWSGSQNNWQTFQLLPKVACDCEKDGVFTTVTKGAPLSSIDSAMMNLNNRFPISPIETFPPLKHSPQAYIMCGKLKEWDKSLAIPPQIDSPLTLSSMDIFKSTLKETAKGTELLKNVVTMQIPVDEFTRALIKGNIQQAANIISLGYDKLLLLKPPQLNFVQNAFVTACEILLKPHLASRETNDESSGDNNGTDEMCKNVSSNTEADGHLERTIVQAYEFIKRIFDQIRFTNNYPPLDSTFLSLAEGTILANTPAESRADKLKELAQGFTPVIFPSEYMNELIQMDDINALEYILNFYNFNLFGGRLPMQLSVKFADLSSEYILNHTTHISSDEKIFTLTHTCQGKKKIENIGPHKYLSSNDLTHSILRPVTIYLSNQLLCTSNKTDGDNAVTVEDKKIIICKLLLDECVDIFKKTVNINEDHWTDDLINLHLSRVIERSNCWPFHYDDAINDTSNCSSVDACDDPSTHRYASVDNLLHEIKKKNFRQDPDTIWTSNKLPLRLINSLAFSGNLLMIESILNSKQAISYFTKLNYKQLHLAENIIKESVKSSFYSNDIVLLAEAISAIDVAFETIRIEWHLHNLISSKTLLEGLINSYNRHAEARGETYYEQKLYPFGPFGQFIALESNDAKPLQHSEIIPYIDCLRQGKKNFLYGVEKVQVTNDLYNYYNTQIFNSSLPKINKDDHKTDCAGITIKFDNIWKSGALSNLKYSDEFYSIITIDENVSDLKMLNDLLLSQMLKMYYMYKVNTSNSVFNGLLAPDYQILFPLAARQVKIGFDEKYLASFKFPKTDHIAVDGTLKSLRIKHFVNQILDARKAFDDRDEDNDDEPLVKISNESSLYGFAHYLLDSIDDDSLDENPISPTGNAPSVEYFRPLFEKLNIPFTIGQLDEEWTGRLTDDEALRLSNITDLNNNVIGMLVSAGFGIDRILELLSPDAVKARDKIATNASKANSNDNNPVTASELEQLEDLSSKESMIASIISQYDPTVVHYTGAVIDELLNHRVEQTRKLIWSLDAKMREDIITLGIKLIEGMKGQGAISPDIADKAMKNLTDIIL